MKYLVNFVYPETVLMTSVDTETSYFTDSEGMLRPAEDEYEIALIADETIFEDIGFAPLQHCQEYTVEELN